MIFQFFKRLSALIVLNIAGWLLIIYLFEPNWNHQFLSLLAFSFFLALCHLILKPIIHFFLKPFVWLTFGLASLVINILILKIGLYYFPIVTISSNRTLILAALLLSIINSLGTSWSKK